MKKQIKQMIKKLQGEKTFLENKIKWSVNDQIFIITSIILMNAKRQLTIQI